MDASYCCQRPQCQPSNSMANYATTLPLTRAYSYSAGTRNCYSTNMPNSSYFNSWRQSYPRPAASTWQLRPRPCSPGRRHPSCSYSADSAAACSSGFGTAHCSACYCHIVAQSSCGRRSCRLGPSSCFDCCCRRPSATDHLLSEIDCSPLLTSAGAYSCFSSVWYCPTY